MPPASEDRTPQRVEGPVLAGGIAGITVTALLLDGPILVILLGLGAIVGALVALGVLAAGHARKGERLDDVDHSPPAVTDPDGGPAAQRAEAGHISPAPR